MFNNNIIYEYPHANRIIIIADIHGDLKRFKNILIDAKIINNNLEWIAVPSNTVVVQLGDQIDSLNRNNTKEWEQISDIEMIYFTNNLDMIARANGGMIISLIGNHEFMNVIGNFSYVSNFSNFELRKDYFKPKGSLSPLLANRPIILKIGGLCFCHAGLKKNHLDILDKYNKDISYINDIWRNFILNEQIYIEDKEIFDKLLLDSDGIIWTRSLDNEETMKYTLDKIKCNYMFIGHSQVENITLLNNQIWYTDTGISRSFNKNNYQYIDIDNYKIQIKDIIDNE